jgi:DNA-binding NarL/FixJ family response regulator
VSRILTKLDCANRVQAALLLRDTGLRRATEAPGTGTG